MTIGYVQAYDSLLHQQRPSDIDITRTPTNQTGTSGKDIARTPMLIVT